MSKLRMITVICLITMFFCCHSLAEDQNPLDGPVELEVTQLTPSYDLDDHTVDRDGNPHPNDHDNRWSMLPWDSWAHTKGKAIAVWQTENVTEPLELTYPVPNGEYDIYLGLNLHTRICAVELQLGPKPRKDSWRWIQTPLQSPLEPDSGAPDVLAGTQKVTDGKLHIWLRNGKGWWAAIDNVKIGPKGFDPGLMGIEIDLQSLLPKPSDEVKALRSNFAAAPNISQVVEDCGDDEFLLCIDITGRRVRPEYRTASMHLGTLDAGMPGDNRYIILASHVYEQCAGRQRMQVGIERSGGQGPLLLEIGYLQKHDGSPNVEILWDDQLLATLNTENKVRFPVVSALVVPQELALRGKHVLEIRESELTPAGQNFALIDAVRITGTGKLALCFPRQIPPAHQRAKLRVYDARFRPDHDTGRDVLRDFFVSFRPEFDPERGLAQDVKSGGPATIKSGSVHLYVVNEGTVPAENFRCYMNGTDLDTLRHEFGQPLSDEARVIWWRIKPRRIPPGGHAEVTIRFTKTPKLPAKFTVRADDSSETTTTVSPAQPPFQIDYVAFSPEADRLYVYLQSDEKLSSWNISSIELDRSDITARCKIRPAGRSHTLITFDMDKPLKEGTYHILSVTDKLRRRHTVQIRAWRCYYIVSAWAGFGPWLNQLQGANFNTVVSRVSPDNQSALERIADRGGRDILTSLGQVPLSEKSASAILAYYLQDEPDAHDDPTGGGGIEWLGRNAQPNIDWADILQDKFPAASCLTVDSTTRPYNVLVYGQAFDMLWHDPYFPPPVVRHQIRNMVRATAPKPTIAVTWAFSEGHGIISRPSPAVMRMNTYSALGVGAKGIIHFSYSFKSQQGYGAVPEMCKAVHELNTELLEAAPYLAISHPIDTTIQVPKGVWARPLLCGDKALALCLVNDRVVLQDKDQRVGPTDIRKGDIIGFEDIGAFDATVELPTWFRAGSVALITPSGRQLIKFTHNGSRLTCHDVTIGAGAIVLITTEAD